MIFAKHGMDVYPISGSMAYSMPVSRRSKRPDRACFGEDILSAAEKYLFYNVVDARYACVSVAEKRGNAIPPITSEM